MRNSALFTLSASLAACYAPDLGPPGTQGLYCHLDDSPQCPDGSTCTPVGSDYRCVTNASSSGGPQSIPMIPKTTMVTPTEDPMLNTTSDCPDEALEPNDTLAEARIFSITPDSSTTPKLINLAICPKGSGDIDVFAIPIPSANLTLYAQIFYDISYGDLDVAILDMNGNIVASDGSAVSNGCTTALTAPGTFYVAIEGANGDVNRYDAQIALYSSPHPCGQ